MSIASTSERNEAKFREYNYRQEVTQADSSALFFLTIYNLCPCIIVSMRIRKYVDLKRENWQSKHNEMFDRSLSKVIIF